MKSNITKQQIQPLNHNFTIITFKIISGGNKMSGWEILIVAAILVTIFS